jgi:general stress protein 26
MSRDEAPHGAEAVPTEKKLEDLYDLIDGISIAMFTTRRCDGRLVSRPMQTQSRDGAADFWFVTDIDADKLDELESDPHVNLAYYRDRTREWVSVSGTARISHDREQVRRLYKPDWKAWFPDDGPGRDGSPDDPRITLLLVDADSVIYMKSDTPRPVVLFEVVKGILTGKEPDIGSVRVVSGGEMHGKR